MTKKTKKIKNVGVEFRGKQKLTIEQIVNQPKGPVANRLSSGDPTLRDALTDLFEQFDRVAPSLVESPAKDSLASAIEELSTGETPDLPSRLSRVLASARAAGDAAAPILRTAEALRDLIQP